MTDSIEVRTAAEFHDSLRELLRTAADNGVDVYGSWPVQDGRTGWDVVVVELDDDGSDHDGTRPDRDGTSPDRDHSGDGHQPGDAK